MPEPTSHAPESADARAPRAVRPPLFQTERGLLRRCGCCERLELRFGNALMAVGADDLPNLLGSLGVAEREAGAAGDRREATLFLGDSGCGWVFTADELAELHRLVAGARLMLDLGA